MRFFNKGVLQQFQGLDRYFCFEGMSLYICKAL